MSNNEIRNSISLSEETNPIVIQLQEFGYDSVYSRRVFYYLHPEDLEEALNYMAMENGIIQHRFVHNRNSINNTCYICGEERDIHLKELNISINVNNNENNLEESNEDQKENDETNSNQIQINSIANNNNYNFDNFSKKSLSSSTIKKNENSSNEKNKNYLSSESLDISFKNQKEIPKKFRATKNKKDINSKKEKIECEICNEMFIVNKNNKVEKCGHAFCSNCWYDFLSVKIKENKLPSIKCLDFKCKEKLKDEFIINLLNSDIDLIKKYKRYKLELEIINDPNKKLCPYPNCDSYLELKQIRNKDVKCKNNHTFCFECLKKPHGKLPCKENLDKSMEEYAKNNFVKKCPKCSIITEKNNGCNHIICTKCKYQWCWLCNEEYNENHFKGGKCKGFQFFQPQNEYEIKLMMEGKIKFNELSNSQMQIDDNFDNLNFNDDHRPHIRHHFRERRIRFEENEEIRYNRVKCYQKVLLVFIYTFFGNWGLNLTSFDLDNDFNKILVFIIYILLYIPLFFQIIYLNILSLLLILIFFGFKKFILKYENLNKLYLKKIILILVTIFLGTFCRIYYFWKRLINETNISNKFGMKFLIFFPCAIMSTILNYPLCLLNNIGLIILVFIYERSFSGLLSELDINFDNAFNFKINSD